MGNLGLGKEAQDRVCNVDGARLDSLGFFMEFLRRFHALYNAGGQEERGKEFGEI